MSLALLNAVLSANHTKSSTRFALALMAYHACSRCGRIYLGVSRLANELNVDPRNAKTLLRKLRDDKWLEPTGETTPQGTVVYRMRGVMLASPEDINRGDAFITGGVMKACRFCRTEVMRSSPNRQTSYRQEKHEGEDGLLTLSGEAAETQQPCVDGQVCGVHHQPGLCGINSWDANAKIP
jgi:hypothetical protein